MGYFICDEISSFHDSVAPSQFLNAGQCYGTDN